VYGESYIQLHIEIASCKVSLPSNGLVVCNCLTIFWTGWIIDLNFGWRICWRIYSRVCGRGRANRLKLSPKSIDERGRCGSCLVEVGTSDIISAIPQQKKCCHTPYDQEEQTPKNSNDNPQSAPSSSFVFLYYLALYRYFGSFIRNCQGCITINMMTILRIGIFRISQLLYPWYHTSSASLVGFSLGVAPVQEIPGVSFLAFI